MNYKPLNPHVIISKGVGSQGEGTAQCVCGSEADQQAVVEILDCDLNVPALPLTLRPSQKIRKAVIPAAGFGTRLFLATMATKKKLFPIIDQDGETKSAILLIVEVSLEAGLEEVIIILQGEDLEDFRSFFTTQNSIENFNKLSLQFLEYACCIREIRRQVSYVVQPTREGFGHVVYCARQAVGDEPFVLMLGNHLYRSNNESCTQQLLDTNQQNSTNILGLRLTSGNENANFSTVSGVWVEPGRLLNLIEFTEKLTVDYARSNLRVPDMCEGEYLTVFGLYVIKPELFEYLEEHITNNVRERGEFQLTSALVACGKRIVLSIKL